MAACNFESIARFTRKLVKGDYLSDFHTFCNDGENKVEEKVHHFPALGKNKALLASCHVTTNLVCWQLCSFAILNEENEGIY